MTNNTQLNTYTLWYDGKISIKSNQLTDFLLQYDIDVKNICVDNVDKDIQQYNKMVPVTQQIGTKHECDPINPMWTLPSEYTNMHVQAVVYKALEEELKRGNYTDEEMKQRIERTKLELSLYRKNNMFDVLKVILYVINTFKQQNIVWGVGRGSSVSSYILYLLEVHDVDSIKYQLNIEDFIS